MVNIKEFQTKKIYETLVETLIKNSRSKTNIKDLIKTVKRLESDQDDVNAFKILREILSINKRSQAAHHYLGKIFVLRDYINKQHCYLEMD